MRTLKGHLAGLICALALTAPATAFAQAGPSAHSKTARIDSDQTLEIAPRAAPPLPAAPAATPAPDDDTPPLPTSGPPISETTPPDRTAESKRPYLGMSVQYVETHSTPGHDVQGLEVVSVDPDSPAENAGLRGRGEMTKLGATGATAGALMPPLDLIVMPLLKKSGQLGGVGDLIVAIDDKRVTGDADLQTALDAAKPGDMIYFTIKRPLRDGSQQTLKLPVKLGQPDQSARN
jgi:hypothetical protein